MTKKIHTLIELYGGNVLPEILRHFNSGDILVFNGPISRLLSSKLNLALLSENEASARFSEEEQETIKKYVPWTRKITLGDTTYKGANVKLENFIRSHKDQLVIKPSEGYGGINVSLGKNKSPGQWDKIISEAISHKNWVVQEYVSSLPYWYQSGHKGFCEYDAIWGTFVLGSQYGGEWVRILPKKDSDGVINTRLGAEVSVVFEVDE